MECHNEQMSNTADLNECIYFVPKQMFSVMKEYDELAFLEEIQQELRSQGRTLLWGIMLPPATNTQCCQKALWQGGLINTVKCKTANFCESAIVQRRK